MQLFSFSTIEKRQPVIANRADNVRDTKNIELFIITSMSP
jgi:hypothetical protein